MTQNTLYGWDGTAWWDVGSGDWNRTGGDLPGYGIGVGNNEDPDACFLNVTIIKEIITTKYPDWSPFCQDWAYLLNYQPDSTPLKTDFTKAKYVHNSSYKEDIFALTEGRKPVEDSVRRKLKPYQQYFEPPDGNAMVIYTPPQEDNGVNLTCYLLNLQSVNVVKDDVQPSGDWTQCLTTLAVEQIQNPSPPSPEAEAGDSPHR